MSTVIIGAGLAGLRTAAELRARGHDRPLVLLGAEPHPPYDRPPLSSELLTRPGPVWLAEDLAIDWPGVADTVRLGTRAVELRLGVVSQVRTGAGEVIDARDVVVTTGSLPLNPWPEALTLHSLEDAARLRTALAGGPRRVAIIGAGWIGVELAHVLAGAGHRVTLLEAGAEPLGAHLGEAAGYVRSWLDHVDLRTGTSVTAVEAGTVRTTGGEVEADVVIAAVGVRPETGWLAGSGVPVAAGGFLPVDAGGRVATGAGRVWAVGDVATRTHPLFGEVPGGHWFSALRDPALVAAAIAGEELPALPTPEVFSVQGDRHIEVIGALAGERTVLRGDVASGAWVLGHLRGSRLVGAVVANSPRETSALRRALSGPELPEVNPQTFADTATPLRRLLRR